MGSPENEEIVDVLREIYGSSPTLRDAQFQILDYCGKALVPIQLQCSYRKLTKCFCCYNTVEIHAVSHPLWPDDRICQKCHQLPRCVICERRCGEKQFYLNKNEKSSGFSRRQIGNYEGRNPLFICPQCAASGTIAESGNTMIPESTLQRILSRIKSNPLLLLDFNKIEPPLEFHQSTVYHEEAKQKGAKSFLIELVDIHQLSRPKLGHGEHPMSSLKMRTKSGSIACQKDWGENLVFGRCESLEHPDNCNMALRDASIRPNNSKVDDNAVQLSGRGKTEYCKKWLPTSLQTGKEAACFLGKPHGQPCYQKYDTVKGVSSLALPAGTIIGQQDTAIRQVYHKPTTMKPSTIFEYSSNQWMNQQTPYQETGRRQETRDSLPHKTESTGPKKEKEKVKLRSPKKKSNQRAGIVNADETNKKSDASYNKHQSSSRLIPVNIHRTSPNLIQTNKAPNSMNLFNPVNGIPKQPPQTVCMRSPIAPHDNSPRVSNLILSSPRQWESKYSYTSNRCCAEQHSYTNIGSPRMRPLNHVVRYSHCPQPFQNFQQPVEFSPVLSPRIDFNAIHSSEIFAACRSERIKRKGRVLKGIAIAQGLPDDIFSSTLSHELTHAYIFARGYWLSIVIEEGICNAVCMIYSLNRVNRYSYLIQSLTSYIDTKMPCPQLDDLLHQYFPVESEKHFSSVTDSSDAMNPWVLESHQQLRLLRERIILKHRLSVYRFRRMMVADIQEYFAATLILPLIFRYGLHHCLDVFHRQHTMRQYGW